MKRRVTRLLATLAITALAITGYALSDDAVATPQDTGWGAPDTSNTTWSTPPTDTGVDATQDDSGWG